MTRIGVFGGSFDPPHLGHKALVEAAIVELELDAVWVIPVGDNPVHRSLSEGVSAKQRLSWVESMFAGMDGVEVFDWEVKSAEPMPSIAFMRRLGKDLPNVPIWLMGMDAWLGLPSWIDYPEHMQWCNMAVFPRHGESVDMHEGWEQVTCLSSMKAGQVYWGQSELPMISATQVREDILTGKDVSTVLDVCIADEIQSAYQKSRNGENE